MGYAPFGEPEEDSVQFASITEGLATVHFSDESITSFVTWQVCAASSRDLLDTRGRRRSESGMRLQFAMC